jgi:hypothetical protein
VHIDRSFAATFRAVALMGSRNLLIQHFLRNTISDLNEKSHLMASLVAESVFFVFDTAE